MSDEISTEPPFEFCGLCGDDLEDDLDVDTGICKACAAVETDPIDIEGQLVGEWLCCLEGLTVRSAGEDADGPILQIDGSDGMAAVEMDTPLAINSLEVAASKLRSTYLADQEGDR